MPFLRPPADKTIVLKSPREVEAIREAGRIVALTIRELRRVLRPGMTTRDLDTAAAQYFRRFGAVSGSFGYFGFPGHICVCVNDEVVHGIPGKRKIRSGDIVKVDVVAVKNGYHGDAAETVAVGEVPPATKRLMQVTYEGLMKGVEQARAGNRLSDIGHAIQSHVEAHGYNVVKEFVGHGIGRAMHEAPQVPNYGPPSKGIVLRPGMVLAIEPQVNLGGADVRILDDGWTAVTLDGSLSAHYEHTVCVTPNGPDILTLP